MNRARRDDSTLLLLVGASAAAAIAALTWWSSAPPAPPKPFEPEPTPDPAARDIEALARVVESEAGSRGTLAEQRAIAWTTRNRAAKRKTSIHALVCSPSCGPCCKGRPFSSRLPATQASRRLAAEVYFAAQSEDPTRGAVAFFEPALQDQLVAEGRKGYRRTSAALRAKWTAEGQRPLNTIGRFEFWI